MTDDRSSLGHKALALSGLALVLALVLIPYVYVIVTAFKPAEEVYDMTWLPQRVSFEAWIEVFEVNRFHIYLWNSLVAGAGSAALAILISVPGAYIFARKEFRFREPLFYMIVGTLIFPFILLIVPITIAWIRIGLFDSFLGLWLAFQIFAVPYSMWILRGYFSGLPRNLEEAAMVYGCTQFQAFYRVMLPLAKPVIVSVLFLAFLQGWSDFLFSNMLTTGDGPRTASVAIYVSTAGGERVDWQVLMVMTLAHRHSAGRALHAGPEASRQDLRGSDVRRHAMHGTASGIEIRNLRKTFGGGAVVACDDVNLDIGSGELLVLLGPSGCGKTTTLRCIAGLERPDNDDAIWVRGRNMTRLAPRDRNLAFVFQDTAMFPNLTVRRNISFGLDMRGSLARAEIDSRGRGGGAIAQDRGAARALSPAALRRPGPARRARPRHRHRTGRLPSGRAAGRARRGAARRDAHRDQADPAQARHHHDLRDARPGGGTHHRRQDRRDEGRPGPAGGHAARHLPPAGQPVRRDLHRLATDQPVRLRLREEGGDLRLVSPVSTCPCRRARASARRRGARRSRSACARSSWSIGPEGRARGRVALTELIGSRTLVLVDCGGQEMRVLVQGEPACARATGSASFLQLERDILDGRMGLKRRLDFGRIDVLAAADDHVALAIDEVVVAVLVAPRHVADRAVRAAKGLGGLLGQLPVAAERIGRARVQLADLAVGDLAPSVQQLDRARPVHSRPIEPSLVSCSSGRSSVTQPASVEPYPSRSCVPELLHDGQLRLLAGRRRGDQEFRDAVRSVPSRRAATPAS